MSYNATLVFQVLKTLFQTGKARKKEIFMLMLIQVKCLRK